MFVVLTYDFEKERVAKALKICRKYLTWVQNSVFEGIITEKNLSLLQNELKKVMNQKRDSFIIYSWTSTKYSKKELTGKEKNCQKIFF